MISSSAETPVNAADRAQIDVTQEAVAAAPEVAQPHDAIQDAPQANLSDAPVNASPEAPIAETTEN
ncbi:hypothetical protein D3C73_1524630 [compost metagenome]